MSDRQELNRVKKYTISVAGLHRLEIQLGVIKISSNHIKNPNWADEKKDPYALATKHIGWQNRYLMKISSIFLSR